MKIYHGNDWEMRYHYNLDDFIRLETLVTAGNETDMDQDVMKRLIRTAMYGAEQIMEVQDA